MPAGSPVAKDRSNAGRVEAAVFHLCGQDAIARTFGVSRNTVAIWKSMGAPIAIVGRKYQAMYLELGWLKANAPV